MAVPKFTAGETFAGETGLKTGQQLEDLVENAEPTANLVDGSTLELDSTDKHIKVKDSGIVAAKIADGAVTTAKIADANVTADKINADAVDGTKIADDSIDSEHYVDGSIDEEHLAAGAVTPAKAAIFNNGTAGVACDSGTLSGSTDGDGKMTITFNQTFASAPVVVVTACVNGSVYLTVTLDNASVTTGGCDVYLTRPLANTMHASSSATIHWIAIGGV